MVTSEVVTEAIQGTTTMEITAMIFETNELIQTPGALVPVMSTRKSPPHNLLLIINVALKTIYHAKKSLFASVAGVESTEILCYCGPCNPIEWKYILILICQFVLPKINITVSIMMLATIP